ncbi:MAG: hypothetical protein R3F43_18855 [bacterium]
MMGEARADTTMESGFARTAAVNTAAITALGMIQARSMRSKLWPWFWVYPHQKARRMRLGMSHLKMRPQGPGGGMTERASRSIGLPR